jgi:hypothetical protein
VTALDRATWQMVTINKVDNFSLSLEDNFGYWGATLPVHTWSYAAGFTDIFLYEQAATEVRGTSKQVPALNASRVEISIVSDLGARPRFEMLPCNFDIVKHPVAGYYMPITGCSGGCWPFEIIVKGAGYDTQSATWPDFQGNLDFTDYKCILYAGTDTIFSSAVFVQDSTTIICKIGQPNSPPLVSSQLFKVNITQSSKLLGWVPTGNSTVFLADAWTGTDCSIDDICKGYAAGSNSTIKVRGFGFRRDAHYKCNFKRGSDEANSTARWLEPRLLECIVPVWNFPAGVAKFRMLKEDFGEIAFEGIGGLGAGYAHEFRFISTWWLAWPQRGSVAGHISPIVPSAFALDPGAPLLTVRGRGFDTSFTYLVRITNGTNQSIPDIRSLSLEYLSKSYNPGNSSHMHLELRVPQYLAPESVVSVDLFKCSVSGNSIACANVERDSGTGLAFLADVAADVTNASSGAPQSMTNYFTYQYVATVAYITMGQIAGLPGPFTCFPSGSQLCWVSSDGGDRIQVRGLGFVANETYQCRFSFNATEKFSDPVFASDGSHIECDVPRWPAPGGPVSVTFVRTADGSSMFQHTLYRTPRIIVEPRVYEMFPTSGFASGVAVTVTGTGFSRREREYACLFAAPNASGIPGFPEQLIASPAQLVNVSLVCNVIWGAHYPAGRATLYVAILGDNTTVMEQLSATGDLLTVSWFDGALDVWDRRNYLKPGLKLKIDK